MTTILNHAHFKMAATSYGTCVLVLFLLLHCGESFTDSNHVFQLQWPGSHSEITDPDHLVVTTRNREKYSCKYKATLGGTTGGDDKEDENQEGTHPAHLLEQLSNSCTRKEEVYWHYKFCYKRKLTQFHEEKLANQQVKLTEYTLGKFPEVQKRAEDDEEGVKSLIYNGISYPYYEITIGGGDVCDLTGRPRKCHLRFICHKAAAFEFVQISEMSSCEYLAVFATRLLCKNPLYRIEEAPVQSIVCNPLEGSPEKPAILSEIEEEITEMSSVPPDRSGSASGGPSGDHVSTVFKQGVKPPKPDADFVKAFLAGTKCLVGGQGWWKQEVCYGSHVKQFHSHAGGQTDILLGTWDVEAHKLWYKKNKRKLDQYRTKGAVVHYYAKGDKCDLTGKPRDVQVRMKCMEGVSLSMSLQEPSTCKYLLIMESSFFCSLISSADEYGLFQYDLEQ